MTWTLDRTTPVGKTRVLITGEAVEATSVFQDEDIEVFLSISDDVVLEAAALGLERIAADQALLFRKIKVGSIEVDGPATSASFLALAARYRGVADSGSVGADEDIQFADMVYDNPTWQERVIKDYLRTGG